VLGWVGLSLITLAQNILIFITLIKLEENHGDVRKMDSMIEKKTQSGKDRLNVDIRGLREALQAVAEAEERSLSNAARILLIEALTARGLKIDKPDDALCVSEDDTIHSVVKRNINKLKIVGIKNLKALANGEVLPTKADFVKISSALELTDMEQRELWQRTFNNINKEDLPDEPS
jgi:hypothetical protein